MPRVRMMHASMRVHNPLRQQRRDVDKIFARARKHNVRAITWTEATVGSGLPVLIRRQADQQGYHYHRHGEISVVVQKKFMPVVAERSGFRVFPNRTGRFTSKAVAGIGGWCGDLGFIDFSGSHLLTKGQGPKSPNWAANREYARQIGDYMAQQARGKRLAFHGSDTNRPNKRFRPFFGENLVTCWDDLKKYPATFRTGATLDVIARWGGDGRVTCKRAWSLDDSQFFLFTDHYLVEAVYDVQTLS